MKTLQQILLTATAAILLTTGCSSEYSSNSSSDSAAPSAGQGGSMARFTIAGDYMYTVDNSTLKMFDLSDPAQPLFLEGKTQELGQNIETIFNMDTLLFIGSQDGMYIYNIVRPQFPEYLANVSHIRSCDPVVASGHYAYVTLNSAGTWCGNTVNGLFIYDISNIKYPMEIYSSTQFNSPKGLGIDGDKLFVCEAIKGVQVFDVSNPAQPVWIDDLSYIPQAKNINTYDVIPLNGLLITSTDQGLLQFDYSGDKIRFVSKITIQNQ
ncbi:MAG: hypothetical protein LBD80_00380 [Tannerella sp.]|jgi:hypothetical protein|nr:hypothetical protein [Tannerella sp.]